LCLGYDQLKKGAEMAKHTLLTKKEVAENLTVSIRSIDRMISAQELRAIKVRGSIRIPLKEVENYIDKQLNRIQNNQQRHTP